MKHILVTGATGLIGKYVCKSLSGSEHIVWGLGRSDDAPADLPDIRWIQCDLAEHLATRIFPEKPDVIIHLAQSLRFRDFPDGARDVFKVNIQSTFELLEYGRRIGIKQFIFASTGGIYGFGEGVSKEDDNINFSGNYNMYLSSKYTSELLVKNYSSFFSPAILRFFFVYGRGQREDMFIPRLISNVKRGKPIMLEGEDGILINPVYVDDVVSVIERILDFEQPLTLNVGGNEVLSLRQIGDIIGSVVGEKPVFEHNDKKESKYLVGDITRLTGIFGAPETTFIDGIKKMIKSD